MMTSDLHVCCGGLVEALGRRAGEGTGATFLLGVGKDGALFYEVGHMAGGQFTSTCVERAAFCPFCGRGVGGAVRRSAAAAAETDEEITIRRIGESQEIETVIAALAARRAPAQIHISEY